MSVSLEEGKMDHNDTNPEGIITSGLEQWQNAKIMLEAILK